jgi:hypothetical protein
MECHRCLRRWSSGAAAHDFVEQGGPQGGQAVDLEVVVGVIRSGWNRFLTVLASATWWKANLGPLAGSLAPLAGSPTARDDEFVFALKYDLQPADWPLDGKLECGLVEVDSKTTPGGRPMAAWDPYSGPRAEATASTRSRRWPG